MGRILLETRETAYSLELKNKLQMERVGMTFTPVIPVLGVLTDGDMGHRTVANYGQSPHGPGSMGMACGEREGGGRSQSFWVSVIP